MRAQLHVLVKRVLRKYGYPPDKQDKATQTVLEQAEVLSELWVAEEKTNEVDHELPLLETNQDRTGRDPEPEQVGRVSLVWAARGEIHHRLAG